MRAILFIHVGSLPRNIVKAKKVYWGASWNLNKILKRTHIHREDSTPSLASAPRVPRLHSALVVTSNHRAVGLQAPALSDWLTALSDPSAGGTWWPRSSQMPKHSPVHSGSTAGYFGPSWIRCSTLYPTSVVAKGMKSWQNTAIRAETRKMKLGAVISRSSRCWAYK